MDILAMLAVHAWLQFVSGTKKKKKENKNQSHPIQS